LRRLRLRPGRRWRRRDDGFGRRCGDGRRWSRGRYRRGDRHNRPPQVQRVEPVAQQPCFRARIERDDQGDNGKDRECEDHEDPQQNKTPFIHGAPPATWRDHAIGAQAKREPSLPACRLSRDPGGKVHLRRRRRPGRWSRLPAPCGRRARAGGRRSRRCAHWAARCARRTAPPRR